jgi:hypothetical protein
MNKFELKQEFIKLRAKEYTYPEICIELNISKPTAIKWGKLYADEINRVQKKLLSGMFSNMIIEQEHGLIVNIRELKRLKKNNPGKNYSRINNRIASEMEKIFLKRIVAIQIIMQPKADKVDRAIFVFNDNVEVHKRTEV